MKWGWVKWCVLVSVLLIVTLAFAVGRNFEDLHVYYAASRTLFLNGRIDLYSPDFADSAIMDYRYPPFFLFLFFPLSFLPYWLVQFIWVWLCIFAFALLIKATKQSYELVTTDPSRVWPAILLALVASAKYFLVLGNHLNVHLIVVALLCVAFYLVLLKRQTLAAVPMALAIAIKISPVLTFPYFVIRRQWRFLWFTGVLVVIFNLVPALYFGWNSNVNLLEDWYQHVVAHDEFHEINGPLDLSFRGQMKRYLVNIDYGARFDDPDYENINVVSLSEAQFHEIWVLPAATLFVGTYLVIWLLKRRREYGGPKQTKFDSLALLEFGLTILLVLLVAPRTNAYYLTALFIPLVPLAHDLLKRRSNFSLVVFGLVLFGTCVLPLVPGRHAQRMFLVLGIDFWVMIVIWIGLIYSLVRGSLLAPVAENVGETFFPEPATSQRIVSVR